MKRECKRTSLSLALLFLCAATPSLAHAADDQPAATVERTSRTSNITMLRFTGLFLHAEAINFGRSWTLPKLGAQLEHIFANRLAVEGGANLLQGTQGTGWDVAGRIGYGFPLGRGGGAVRTIATPLIGYHLAHRPVLDPSDGYSLFNRTHSAQGGLAMDAVWKGEIGFSLRFFTAFDYAFISERRPGLSDWSYTTAAPMRTSVQVGLAIGMVIR